MKTRLVHGNDIHIPFAENLIGCFRSFGNVKSVKVSALIKYFCLRRIEIFGFAVPHYPASESDHLPADIHDRKDHAVPEFIMHSPFFVKGGDSGFQDHFV